MNLIKKGVRVEDFFKMYPYQELILNEFDFDLLDKGRKREKIDLLKIFVKHIKNTFKEMSYTNNGYFLNRNHATIINLHRGHDNLYFSDIDFKKKSIFVRSKFLHIDKHNKSEIYKKKCLDIINNCPEDYCEIFYNAIIKTKPMIENKQTV